MSCSHLSELCDQLLSHQAPRLDPHECISILLKKYEGVECVLLQLSTLRWLYSYHTPFPFPSSPVPAVGETCEEDEASSEVADSPPESEDSEVPCYSTYMVKVLNCLSQYLPDLLQVLMGHLRSENQFISFCASKTLVCAMLQLGVQDQNITDIFSTFKTGVHSHVGVYSLQTVRECLKSLRKHLHSAGSTLDATMVTSLQLCFQSLNDHQLWLNALNLLHRHSEEASSHRLLQTREKLALTVGEFLSLTVEMIRHEQPAPSPPNSSPPSSAPNLPLHTECIIKNLSKLFSLVELHDSLFLFKRFVDIAQKSVEKAGPVQVAQCVAPVLVALLGLLLCRELVQYWMKECSVELLPVSVSRSLAHTCTVAEGSTQFEYKTLFPEECGLVNTTVRKLTVLCLKCMASVVCIQPPSTGTSSTAAVSLDNLLIALKELLSSVFSIRGGSKDLRLFNEILFHVVSEEDGCLTQTLQALRDLWTHSKASVGTTLSSDIQMALPVVNPHTSWLLFLQSISHDHSVLLDLLLSPETNFGGVLHSYLELVIVDWDTFEEVCREQSILDRLSHSSRDSAALCPSVSDCNGGHNIREAVISRRKDLDHGKLSLSPPVSKKTKFEEQRSTDALVEYSSSSDEEDPMSSCVLASPGGGPQAGCSSAPPSHLVSPSHPMPPPHLMPPSPPSIPACPIEPLLDKVLGCFIRLRLALERLEEAKLFPEDFSASAMIRSIGRVEELYEKET